MAAGIGRMLTLHETSSIKTSHTVKQSKRPPKISLRWIKRKNERITNVGKQFLESSSYF